METTALPVQSSTAVLKALRGFGERRDVPRTSNRRRREGSKTGLPISRFIPHQAGDESVTLALRGGSMVCGGRAFEPYARLRAKSAANGQY
jgi:hypothetical protein